MYLKMRKDITMIIRELMNKLTQYTREGELCSCPFILVNNNQVELAVFTYYASEGNPITVFGYGQIIKTNGTEIIVEEKELFEKESDLIVIDDSLVPIELHRQIYNSYYETLQTLIDNYMKNEKSEVIDNLSILFQQLIPSDAMELYRRMCPSFLKMLKIQKD